ncbi:unnamed protein product [Allacma fusca]|uniref:C2H2-type domain-containing protein n=1 Tax=Allacma fusca TaxID=39272 RepID=A0A8J2L0L6_9HEXA|nr:unnamed protein product [Allacma fusca]
MPFFLEFSSFNNSNFLTGEIIRQLRKMNSLSPSVTKSPTLCGPSGDQSNEVQGDGQVRSKGGSGANSIDGDQLNATRCLKCQFCSEILLGVFKLNKHLKKVHNARISITCNLCGEKFKRNKEFKRHLISHHSSTEDSSPKGKRNVGKKNSSGEKIPRKTKRGKLKTNSRKRKRVKKREKTTSKPGSKGSTESQILPPSPAVTSSEPQSQSSGKEPNPPEDAVFKQDEWNEFENDFLKSTNVHSDNELEETSTGSNCIIPEGGSPVKSGPKAENDSDVEFLEEVELPQRTKNMVLEITEVNLFPCRKCGLNFTTSEFASIHSAFHTLKVNGQFRCLSCHEYLNTLPEYQRHLETSCRHRRRPKRLIQLYMRVQNRKDRNLFAIFQCLHCAKVFPTRASLKSHHELNISHAVPAVDPLQIDLKSQKNNMTQTKQSSNEGMEVRKSYKITLSEHKITDVAKLPTETTEATPIEIVEIEEKFIPVENAGAINVIPMIVKANKRKASRKEATSSVMYHGFDEDVVFVNPDDNETSKPVSIQTNAAGTKSARTSSTTTNKQVNKDPTISPSEENLYCERCDKIFTAQKKFIEHMRYHVNKNRYVCSQCGRKFTHAKEYKGHLEVHEGLNPFKCSLCLKYFSSSVSLRQHNRTIHEPKPTEKRFRCTHCNNRYATQRQLRDHLIRHRRRGAFMCETCGKLFNSGSALDLHTRGHLGDLPLKCSVCNMGFDDQRRFDYHVRRHGKPDMRMHANNPSRAVMCDICGSRMSEAVFPKHMLQHEVGFPRPFPCSVCDKNFSQNASRNKHLLSHPDFSGNICRHCYKELPSKELLEEHESQHPPKVNRLRVCEVCGKCLATSYGLKQHMLLHGTEMPYQCHECGKFFTARSSLKLHSFMHSKSKQFSCKFCDHKYKYPTMGYIHVLCSHTGPDGFLEKDKLNREKNFYCEVCAIGFVKEESLRQHQIYHQKTKSIKCKKTDCGEMFFTIYDRGYHMRTVHERKACEFCGKEFNFKAELDQHRRYNHTGETPYSCTLCDKKYKSKPDLNYHMATHTGEYKFQCEYCEKKFISKANMHAHVRIHTNHQCRKCGVTCGSAKAWKKHNCQWKLIKGLVET